MKTLKLFFVSLVIGLTFANCSTSIERDHYVETLEEVITKYDLWYIDIHRTTGYGEVPFLSNAFTLSFLNGTLYANNNIVDIGFMGDGYGVKIGYYDTYNEELNVDHDYDGIYTFEVIALQGNELKVIDRYNEVTYYFEGYQLSNFDFDYVFYDNIEYFLQEYEAWEKTYVSEEGEINDFDYENYLKFTPENITTFYSSQDPFGTDIANIYWDYVGTYHVADVQDYDNLKILTLDYDSYGNEEFELTVINDEQIGLYHWNSGTTYEFTGKGFIQYYKSEMKKDGVRNKGRKRPIINREKKVRRNLK